MFRDPICSSECQKKCSISDRQSADTPPDSSDRAVESVIKICQECTANEVTEFQHAFGLSLILHPANAFKKGKVPIVKQMLPVMVRSVCATKYSVEHLRHFKHKTIAQFLLETTISVRRVAYLEESLIPSIQQEAFLWKRGEALHFASTWDPAWKQKPHFERASAAWAPPMAPPRDTPGLTQMGNKNDLPRKTVALQWRYKSFFIEIMLISLFSPGARQASSQQSHKAQDIVVCTCTVYRKSTR